MIRIMKQGVRALTRRLGYDIVPLQPTSERIDPLLRDFDEPTARLWRYVQPYTMTSMERIFTLRQAIQYIVRNQIPGDFAECGVWKGGSMMAIAKTLIELGATDRTLYLFDTFEGMSEPTAVDKDYRGQLASDIMKEVKENDGVTLACIPLDEVRKNMRSTGYDPAKIVFVKGKVEDTLPAKAPERLALLRLDTDWYESTHHEMVHLYPRLSNGGVLIIDDYGHFEGARLAVDRYINEQKLKVLLHRIDYTGRICVKNDLRGC